MATPTSAPVPPPASSLSPAEQAIADSRAAYQSFLDTANAEVFEPQANSRSGLVSVAQALSSAAPTAAAINPLGQQLSQAAQQAAGIAQPLPTAPATTSTAGPPRDSTGKFVPRSLAPPPAPNAPAQGTVAQPSAVVAAPSPADSSASLSPQTATADPFADVPAATAFDTGTRLPQTKDWKRLHAKADTFASEYKKLQAEVAALRAQPAQPQPAAVPNPEIEQRLTTLAAERDDLAQRLQRVAFEQSPQFQSMFSQKEQAAMVLARQAVPPEDAKAVEEILKGPASAYRDQQIAAIHSKLADANPIQANKLLTAVASLDSLAAEKQVVLSNSKDYIARMQADQAAQMQRQQAERQRTVTAAFDSELNHWRASGLNDMLDNDGVALAREVYTGNTTLEGMSRAVLWGVVGPKVAARAMELETQLANANSELQRLRGVQPGAAHDAGSAQNGQQDIMPAQPYAGQYTDLILKTAAAANLPWR